MFTFLVTRQTSDQVPDYVSVCLRFFLFLLPRTVDLGETNLAEFGSALEKEHRKEEGALEKAWAEDTGVGSEAGLWVWRIEQFQVLPVAKKDYGRFYSGDSYVILKVCADQPKKVSTKTTCWPSRC